MPSPRSLWLATFAVTMGTCTAQQLQFFPTGPYFANCRGPETADHLGGDDDFYNVWYFEVDRSVVVPDGTSQPDFWILLYDGDCNPLATAGGTNDLLGSTAARTAFEYRLFGGNQAAANEERYANQGNPNAFVGTEIRIDADGGPGDLSLRTDDPDDVDGNAAEDLRDQALSHIGVDIDNHPGEIRGNTWVYKFTVDARSRILNAAGTGNNLGNDRNRYKLLATRDWGGTDARGIQLMTYEYSIAGRPTNSVTDANIGFVVPPTPDNRIDLQTLDLDDGIPAVGNVASRLATSNRLYTDAETYETVEQFTNGAWRWSSVVQAPNTAPGTRGAFVSTLNQVGDVWVYIVDPAIADNAFSFRIWSSQTGGLEWLPIRLVSVFEEYGDGPLRHYGAGLPRWTPGVTDEITLFVENAVVPVSGQVGVLLFGFQRTNQTTPIPGLIRYTSSPFPLPEPTEVFLFGTNGAWQRSIDIPNGIGGFTFHSQAFQLLDAIGTFAPTHGNGLTVRL